MILKLALISLLIIVPLQPILAQNTTESIDKLKMIEIVLTDVQENCNRTPPPPTDLSPELDDIMEKISRPGLERANDNCQKGMAWLKIECDLNYDQSQLCKENMPTIKKFLGEKYIDDRDITYFHEQFQNRINVNFNATTNTIDDPPIDIFGNSTTEKTPDSKSNPLADIGNKLGEVFEN